MWDRCLEQCMEHGTNNWEGRLVRGLLQCTDPPTLAGGNEVVGGGGANENWFSLIVGGEMVVFLLKKGRVS